MIKEVHIPLFDIAMCLTDAIDLTNQFEIDHHKRVSYIALSIADAMGLSTEEQNSLLLAGLLHDSGALSLKERLDFLQFEVENPYEHAELGYLLLKDFKPFSKIALLIRYHHTRWDKGRGSEFRGNEVPIGSHILHLAEEVAILIRREKKFIGQVKGICEQIKKNSGTMFVPELVDVFRSLSAKEYFWLDVVSPSIRSILARRAMLVPIELDIAGLLNLSKIFCQIIDFRSRFTATHSIGVAATAKALSMLMGFSEREYQMMEIAGYLHDLGKLAIPIEILEKPAKLTEDEFNVIKSHVFYTYRILETLTHFDTITVWAAFHHERLDGKGYPFHLENKDLSLGTRIMAIADVFTAISEDRPYRKGMSRNKALQVLEQMVQDSVLDPNVLSTMRIHYDEVNSIRIFAQAEASKKYQEFWRISNTH